MLESNERRVGSTKESQFKSMKLSGRRKIGSVHGDRTALVASCPPGRRQLRLLIASLLASAVTTTILFVVESFHDTSLGSFEQINPIQQAMKGYTRQVEVHPEQELHPEHKSFGQTDIRQEHSFGYSTMNEHSIPNPPPSDGNKTFSACLLVMDDNHRLVEWLAYHYHVLPLRYIIVAVDPRSESSPTYLFNQWRRKGMVIVEWEDKTFWKPRSSKSEEFDLKPIPEDADLQVSTSRTRSLVTGDVSLTICVMNDLTDEARST